MDPLIDTVQAAALLGVSKSLLDHDRLRPSLGVPYIKLGAAVRYDPAAVLAWARSRMVNAPTAQPTPTETPAVESPRRGRKRKPI